MANKSANTGKKQEKSANTPEKKQKRPGSIGAKHKQKTGEKGNRNKGKNAI